MRKKLIAGNWKMNGLKEDSQSLVEVLSDKYKNVSDKTFDMFIAPPFTLIDTVVSIAKGSGIWIGGQDCSAFEKGAHTGDISPVMLKDLGCGGVILGHSERRSAYKESSEQVQSKATAALNAGLGVIICVGETLEDRENGKTLDVIGSQVKSSLPSISKAGKVVIAYEPIWAIGTGKIPTLEQIEEVHAFIRNQIADLLGKNTAEEMQILYGGSVKPSNAAEILSLPDVDGALVGGASLKADDFWAIAKTVM